MIKINTTRFGDIEIDTDKPVHFPEGLVGFPDDTEFVLLEHKPNSPFMWLQSISSPELAFVITNPFLVNPDYLKDITDEEKKLFTAEGKDNITIFAIVTIPNSGIADSTINLMGPVVINPETKEGRQVILANSGYSHQCPLTWA